ncbi:MAG TPA: ATP-binding protein, partial [Bacteroidota bacterium]
RRRPRMTKKNTTLNQYQTLYVFDTDGEVSLALTMGRLDLRWHLFSWSKVVFFFVILGLLLWTAVVGVRSIFGYRYRVTFGHKVLAGLLFVALIPIVLLALYNRQLVLDRIEDFTTRRLRSELGLVNLRLQENLEQGVQQFRLETNDEYCRRIANEVGTDFNVYMDGRLLTSSRPELFEADLLDTQTSSASYVNILLKRKNFFRETESIGRYPYVVGYSPIVGPDERIAGMIGVPTLYRQSEIDEELAKRNAFIFGVYALVVVFVVAGGAVFALRIARPIRSLTLATKRIAEGDLGIEIPSGRRDEIGDLVDSFNAMSRDLKKSREELARVERELAWREMAKQVAHEIKNPLTPMKLSVQHLRQAYKDRARNWKQIFESVTRTLLDQIDTLSHIASEFSRVARMPAAGGTACDINKVVQEAVALFSQEEGIEFRTEYDQAVPSIVADPEELRRAFINIIRNGIQAIRLKSGARGRISLKTRRMDGTASVRFEDDGCGIPEEVKAKLFQPYFSTKTDGMGLGLVLVHRTVDQLGGTVTVESAVGRGTTVEVSLPLPRPPAKKKSR